MGLDWDHLDVHLKICGYSLWERGVACSRTWLPRPFVNDNDLWIFDTGKGVMNMINGKTPLHKNSIIRLRPGHQYIAEQDPEDPLGLIYIHFDLIKPDGSFYFPDVHEMPENFECFNHAHWCAMGRNIIRIKTLAEQKQFPGTKSDMQKTLNTLLKSMLMGIELCDAITRVNNTSGKTNMIAIQAAEFPFHSGYRPAFRFEPQSFHPHFYRFLAHDTTGLSDYPTDPTGKKSPCQFGFLH